MKLRIVDASWHRNGVCGVGFYAILFEDLDEDVSPIDKLKIASLFDEPGYCAVYSVGRLEERNVAFARGNSWRGDQYAAVLRPLLEEFNAESGGNRMGAFSAIPPEAIKDVLDKIKQKEKR